MGLRIIILASLWATSSLAQVATPNPSPAPKKTEDMSETRVILRSISARYQTLRAWRARFSQETFSTGLGKGNFSAGEMTFVPPNKFRYTIVNPDASDFVSNGREAWQIQYRKGREKPAFVRHFRKVSGTELDRYLVFLRGFDVSTPAKEKAFLRAFEAKGAFQTGDLSVELKPRQASDVAAITLLFKNDIEAPYRVVVVDTLGNRTMITVGSFEQIKTPVDEKTFAPDYPKGSEVEEL